jgi:hypothetical protein
MKIGISGTYSTGKSSLVAALSKLLTGRNVDYGVTSVSEAALRCPFPINMEQTLDGSLWILNETVNMELVCDSSHAVTIADRTVVDVLAMSRYAARRHRGTNGKLELILDIVRAWVATYDLLFRARVDASQPVNWAKVPDGSFRLFVQEMQGRCIRELQIPVVELPHDKETRVALILRNAGLG